jgi:hypothetical protein
MFTIACSNNTGKTKTKETNTSNPAIEELNTLKSNKLTLDTVKQLAKNGDKLSWEDFKIYEGKDIGSGLYIMMYPINDKYKILVGGSYGKDKPMYIYLVNNAFKDNEKRIDIRYDNVDKFINSET